MECKLVKVSHIKIQRNVRKISWAIWKVSFKAQWKLGFITDQYGWKSEVNFWWKSSISIFNNICETGYGTHGNLFKIRIVRFLLVKSLKSYLNTSNGRGTHIQTHTLMGEICEVRRWDWFRHLQSEVGGSQAHRHTDSMVISKAYSYFCFFKIRKTG